METPTKAEKAEKREEFLSKGLKTTSLLAERSARWSQSPRGENGLPAPGPGGSRSCGIRALEGSRGDKTLSLCWDGEVKTSLLFPGVNAVVPALQVRNTG